MIESEHDHFPFVVIWKETKHCIDRGKPDVLIIEATHNRCSLNLSQRQIMSGESGSETKHLVLIRAQAIPFESSNWTQIFEVRNFQECTLMLWSKNSLNRNSMTETTEATQRVVQWITSLICWVSTRDFFYSLRLVEGKWDDAAPFLSSNSNVNPTNVDWTADHEVNSIVWNVYW